MISSSDIISVNFTYEYSRESKIEFFPLLVSSSFNCFKSDNL